MTNFLIDEPFVSHSGRRLPFKIDADALTDADLTTVARLVARRLAFSTVLFIPRGGQRLANALLPYVTPGSLVTLIVDDVLTTGASMEELRDVLLAADRAVKVLGFVLFARGPCPSWVTPFFTLHEVWR